MCAWRKERTHRHTLDLTQLLIDALVQLDVRETLDAISSNPFPSCLPCDCATTQAGDLGALRAGRCSILAPEVEEHSVRASVDGIPLTTVLRSVDGLTSDEISVGPRLRSGCGQRKEGECGEEEDEERQLRAEHG